MKFLPSLALIALLGAGSLESARAATLLHRWSFDTLNDAIGAADVALLGTASLAGGQLQLPGGAPRTNYASVPIDNTIATHTSLSIESWFTLDALTNWSKVWMFGTAGGQPAPLSYLNFTPRTGLAGNAPKIDFDTMLAGEFNTVGGGDPAALVTARQYHVVTVYDSANDLMSYYIDGALADSAGMGGGNVTELGPTPENYFGAAVNFGDPDLDGRINEIRIWDGPLSEAEVSASFALGPDVVIPEPSSMALGLAGLSLLALRRRQR